MKPTPGPWTAQHDLRSVFNYNGVITDGPYAWGVYGLLRVANVCENDTPEVQAANAHLITASPEMFECVAAFVRRFGVAVECDEGINGADAVDWISQNMHEFRNAMNKARGLTP